MKRKRILITFFFLLAGLLTGCGGQTADEYVKERLEELKSGDDTAAEQLLETGIEETADTYVIQFPEELKEPYTEFIKEACKSFTYEIVSSEKHNSGYKVVVELVPADLSATVAENDEAYVQNLQSADLTAEVTALLKQDKELLGQAAGGNRITLPFYLSKEGSGYQIDESSWEKCRESILSGYMDPYKHVAEVIDAADYLKAILDASYKGEPARYAEHSGLTEAEVLKQYEDSFAGIDLADMEMSDEQESRFVEAMKAIFRQCRYEVGVARKDPENGYRIQVTVTPNRGLADSVADFQANINSGVYGTQDQAKEGYLTILEAYAASPVYADPVSTEINLSMGALMIAGSGDSELDRLGDLMLPAE